MKSKSIDYLYKIAFTDILTGLKNGNAYEEKLNELRMHKSKLKNLTVIVVDIDNLKYINDNYGHHTGDEAIKATSECIKKVFCNDFCSRVGGDEFVIFTYSHNKDRLSEFNRLIRIKHFEVEYPFNVSVGLSKYVSGTANGIDDLLKQSDKNMYMSKHENKTQEDEGYEQIREEKTSKN